MPYVLRSHRHAVALRTSKHHLAPTHHPCHFAPPNTPNPSPPSHGIKTLPQPYNNALKHTTTHHHTISSRSNTILHNCIIRHYNALLQHTFQTTTFTS